MAGRTMTEAEMTRLIRDLNRAEIDQAPGVYLKAVRVTLEALGYDLTWLQDTFRPALESYYWDEV